MEAHAGTGMEIENSRHALTARYDLGLLRYDRFAEANDAVHHLAKGRYSYELSDDGAVGFGDEFRVTTDPASSEFTARVRRRRNDAFGTLKLPLGSAFFTGVEVRHSLHEYRRRDLGNALDRREVLVAPRIGLNVTEKLRTYAEYRYGDIRYDVSGNKDSETHGVRAGAEGDIASRLSGGLSAGFTSRRYEHAQAGSRDSDSTASVAAKLAWSAPARVQVALRASRRFEESGFNRHYRATSVSAQITKPLRKSVVLGLEFGYGRNVYPDSQTLDGLTDRRRDTMAQAGVRAQWTFAGHFAANLGYTFRARDSNFGTFDYENNVVTAGLGVKL